MIRSTLRTSKLIVKVLNEDPFPMTFFVILRTSLEQFKGRVEFIIFVGMLDCSPPLLDIFQDHVNLVCRVCIHRSHRPFNVKIYLWVYLGRKCFILVNFLRVVMIFFIY